MEFGKFKFMYSRGFDHTLGLSRWIKALIVFMARSGVLGFFFAFLPDGYFWTEALKVKPAFKTSYSSIRLFPQTD